MKKKKLLKRIEELERRNTQLEDDKKAILMERFIYKQDEKHEQLFLKALSSGVNTFTPITNPIYEPDPILFNKYCKECKSYSTETIPFINGKQLNVTIFKLIKKYYEK